MNVLNFYMTQNSFPIIPENSIVVMDLRMEPRRDCYLGELF